MCQSVTYFCVVYFSPIPITIYSFNVHSAELFPFFFFLCFPPCLSLSLFPISFSTLIISLKNVLVLLFILNHFTLTFTSFPLSSQSPLYYLFFLSPPHCPFFTSFLSVFPLHTVPPSPPPAGGAAPSRTASSAAGGCGPALGQGSAAAGRVRSAAP